MIAENLQTGLGVRVVGWFEAQFGDSCNYQKTYVHEHQKKTLRSTKFISKLVIGGCIEAV